jgi:hypothetical protein
MHDHATHGTSYAGYWIAWGILLGITLLMLAIANPALLVAGMAAKATIIALWFMHLRTERLSLTLTVGIGIVVTTLILFGLIAPDGMAS